MGAVMLHVLGLVQKASVFTCFLAIHALAGLPIGEGIRGLLDNENVLISIAPVAYPPSYGIGFQSPLILPPRSSGPVPQPTKGLDFSPHLSPLSTPPSNLPVPPTASIQHGVPAMPPGAPPEKPLHAGYLSHPSMLDAPVPSIPPSSSSPSEPRSAPPNSRPTIAPENNARHSPISPVSNASAPTSILGSPPPSHSFLPEEPPSIPPVPDTSSTLPSPGNSPPTDPILPEEPPSSPPVPSIPPSSSSPSEPRSAPSNSRPTIAPENNAPHSPIFPVSNASAPTSILGYPPPSHSFLPEEPPSIPPVPDASSTPSSPVNTSRTDPILPEEPPSSPPVSNASAPMSILGSPPPSHSFLREEPPSIPPAPDTSSTPLSPGDSPPNDPILPEEPPSSPPEQSTSSIATPPPTVTGSIPVASPVNSGDIHYAPISHSPYEAPSASKLPRHSNSVPPHPYSELTPMPHPLQKRHHARDYKITPAPLFRIIPPTSSEQAPRSGPVTDFGHYAPPPITGAIPVASPVNSAVIHHEPTSHSPSEAPSASKLPWHSNSAPPHPYSELTPAPYPLQKWYHSRNYKITPAPLFHIIPPTSSEQAPRSGPTSDFRHYAPPPITAGSSQSTSPILPPIPSSGNHPPPIFSSPPKYPPEHAKVPFVSPIVSPSGSTTKSPKMPPPFPLQELPPPPPHKACAPLTCIEPLTYGPPYSPCVCVLPIQVGLRLTVALYTFFPLVSELAKGIAAGVYLNQSQVRIMGANTDGVNPQKTIVLIDLIPLGETFDDTTAYLTFQRFWLKQVVISMSLFGDYDVLYVRYPGLPPSPPLPPSTIGIVGSNPYAGRDNNSRTAQPLGVDVSRNQHNDGPNRGILASIIVSAFIVFVLFCAIAWIFMLKRRNRGFLSNPTPPTTIRSLAKSSGRAVSMVGSGPSSPFSLSSSTAAYTGTAKTFSLSDIERATDHFNETRILGEGGFGVVYSGLLEDGTKVAMKILKRYDQQGGREFLAEVEMLGRLHHRNLVKLIGICVEDRTRCLVYELIPNGSVESHLHGIDKESAPLDWNARLKIALGAARALAYLHEDSSPRVIHRDFKASNILLEDDYTPKVSDFGLARTALEEENRHISTRVMGTFGYVAPEYAMTGHLLVKSDVYSYGVVLLELLTGKKPIDLSQPPGQENLVSWSRPLLTSREGLESIIDPSLGPDFPFDSIAKVAVIASMCVEPEVSHRPFMGEVVQALKLVYNECDETKEFQEDLSIDMEDRKSTNSDRLTGVLLNQSQISVHDYRLNAEKDLSMSELLCSSAKPGGENSESFRWNSCSGPLKTSRLVVYGGR